MLTLKTKVVNTQNSLCPNLFMVLRLFALIACWKILHNGVLVYISTQLQVQGCHIHPLRLARVQV